MPSSQDDTTAPAQQAALRALPSVDELAHDADLLAYRDDAPIPHAVAVAAIRGVLREARAAIRAGGPAPSRHALLEQVRNALDVFDAPHLRPVINATGVIINTNLGRAPLSEAAIAAMSAVARGYSNLEYDLDVGGRGSRHMHVRALIREITGAEDALVVNNNAAAILVVLSALASGREVIVSRGELVEIGGGFRVPDVMRQGGARLVEVGTTNRTRLHDYDAAITPETAALLSVHPSNFRIVGFTETADLAALADVAHAHKLPLIHDLGSGSLERTEHWGLAHEPTVRESIAAGVDIVCFSGDKLLGGPQAGIILGSVALLTVIERHPLMRAVRVDKLTLAALEATLQLYRNGQSLRTIPVWQAITRPMDEIRQRAENWTAQLVTWGVAATAMPGESTVGGGSLPGETMPSTLCIIHGLGASALDVAGLAHRLRLGQPAVVARVFRDQLLLDPRTVAPEQDAALLAAIKQALPLT